MTDSDENHWILNTQAIRGMVVENKIFEGAEESLQRVPADCKRTMYLHDGKSASHHLGQQVLFAS